MFVEGIGHRQDVTSLSVFPLELCLYKPVVEWSYERKAYVRTYVGVVILYRALVVALVTCICLNCEVLLNIL